MTPYRVGRGGQFSPIHNIRRNPFVKGIVKYVEKDSAYEWIGFDVFGRAHKSPVLYKHRQDAIDSLKSKLLNLNKNKK